MKIKNILHIDTLNKNCIIYILYKNKFYKKKIFLYKNHLKFILNEIENIFKLNNIKISKINYISFINYPNNTISSKIGISISYGISFGL